jgi:hypothetical protein
MLHTLPYASALAALLAAAPRPAAADPPPETTPTTYAIVIGSNAGGPGQDELHFAETDAQRVAAVLVELGGFTADRVDVVLHPTPDAVRQHLAHLAEQVTADAAAGRQSRVLFYYSGHARAQAIDLGADELPLDELRQKLFAIPATLTVVVLDACQSGAFSRVKGAAPAADFSFSSRQHLDASGVAVLASSTGSELSQESEQLHGSYFTHNLIVGLRGAGDANGDGQVSLDEAYRYAYHQTLLATAETAVGGQHVTFEADLKGHGEVPLSYPRAASAAIVLPPALEGKTLVEDRRASAVVAETYKAKGAAVRIAVAPGDYRILVRRDRDMLRCDVEPDGNVDLGRCTTEALVPTLRKGGWSGLPYRVEVDGMLGSERSDAYTQSLAAFGYSDGLNVNAGLQVVGLRHVAPYFWAGALISDVGMPQWTRGTGAAPQTLDWSTVTVAAVGRGELAFTSEHAHPQLSVYGQLAGGLGIGTAHFTGAQGENNDHSYAGLALSAGAGLHLETRIGIGVTLGYQYSYAPVVNDLIGNTHASGGHSLLTGVSYSF